MITRVFTTLDELSQAINDPLIKIQNSLNDLLSYLMEHHYHTTINGVQYYYSNYSVGINQPVTIIFTELNKPESEKQLKLVLRDKAENVIFEKEMDLVSMAEMFNDPQIKDCANEAELELYLVTHHYRTRINGEPYWHKTYSWGINHLPTFEFVKI